MWGVGGVRGVCGVWQGVGCMLQEDQCVRTLERMSLHDENAIGLMRSQKWTSAPLQPCLASVQVPLYQSANPEVPSHLPAMKLGVSHKGCKAAQCAAGYVSCTVGQCVVCCAVLAV